MKAHIIGGMGKQPMDSQRRLAGHVVNVIQMIAGALLYMWSGVLIRDGGGISFDNHLGSVYTLMFLMATGLMVYGFVQFGRSR